MAKTFMNAKKLLFFSVLFSGFLFSSSTSAATTTEIFRFTGATSSWTVPADVSSITINVLGAPGGNYSPAEGDGGSSTGTLAVSEGQTYYFCIGGIPTTEATGGFCGGGRTYGTGQSSAGGGMTWLSTGSSFNSSTVIIVGGGGGGGGGGEGTGGLGDGGGVVGGTGGNGNTCVPTGGGG